MEKSGTWLIRSTSGFLGASDPRAVERTIEGLLITYRQASTAETETKNALERSQSRPFPTGAQRGSLTNDDYRRCHQLLHPQNRRPSARLKSTSGEPANIQEVGPELDVAIKAAFRDSPQTPVSEGELARAALDLLAQDTAFAEPICVMASQACTTGLPQRYLDPTGIALTTATLLVLQTRVKFKRDHTGKSSIEVDKKSAGDSSVKLLVERLLSFLKR